LRCPPTLVNGRLRQAITRRRLDFKFNELVPLRIGAIALRDGKKFAEPLTRIYVYWLYWLYWFVLVHIDIMRHEGQLLKLLARFE
jgi:hypothetical protein